MATVDQGTTTKGAILASLPKLASAAWGLRDHLQNPNFNSLCPKVEVYCRKFVHLVIVILLNVLLLGIYKSTYTFNMLRTREEGHLWYEVPVSNVRRERPHSLHPHSPGVHSLR